MIQTSNGILGKRRIEQVPGGVLNGVNTEFTLSPPALNVPPYFVPVVTYNGIRLVANESWTLSPDGTTLTLVAAPLSGDILVVDYHPSSL